MPFFRAMNGEPDNEVSRKLLLNGFTLMGMRVYETLLLVKYLQYLDIVNPDRIGIISHSGGSSAANLVVRVSKDIKAQVTDYFVEWAESYEGIHCEAVPGLAYYQTAINNYQSAPIPILSVPYSFTGRRERITNFFNQYLSDVD